MDPPIVESEDIGDEIIIQTWTPEEIEQLDGFVPYDDPEMDMTMFAGIQPYDLVYIPADCSFARKNQHGSGMGVF